MVQRRHRQGLLATLLGVMALVAAIAAVADTGKVIDAATGRPIRDVYVIARWSGEINRVVDSSHTCFHVEAAQTDENGEFKLSDSASAGNLLLYDVKRTFMFYRRGYMGAQDSSWSGPVYGMKTDHRSSLERMRDIRLITAIGCGTDEQRRTTLLP